MRAHSTRLMGLHSHKEESFAPNPSLLKDSRDRARSHPLHTKSIYHLLQSQKSLLLKSYGQREGHDNLEPIYSNRPYSPATKSNP